MSVSNDVPAQSAVAQPVTYPQFVAGVAPEGDVHQACPPVRRRVTWGLSMMCGVGGWLLIVGTSVLGVYNTLTAANEDEAALREYGFGVAIVLMLLLFFVVNVIGALTGFIALDYMPGDPTDGRASLGVAIILYVVPFSLMLAVCAHPGVCGPEPLTVTPSGVYSDATNSE